MLQIQTRDKIIIHEKQIILISFIEGVDRNCINQNEEKEKFHCIHFWSFAFDCLCVWNCDISLANLCITWQVFPIYQINPGSEKVTEFFESVRTEKGWTKWREVYLLRRADTENKNLIKKWKTSFSHNCSHVFCLTFELYNPPCRNQLKSFLMLRLEPVPVAQSELRSCTKNLFVFLNL